MLTSAAAASTNYDFDDADAAADFVDELWLWSSYHRRVVEDEDDEWIVGFREVASGLDFWEKLTIWEVS